MEIEQKTVPYFRAFRLKYLPVTNYRPARIKIIDYKHHCAKIILRDYETTNYFTDAIKYLNSLGIIISGEAEISDNECILLTLNFDTSIVSK